MFGLFKLDIYKDALHVASGLWALIAAIMSRRAAMLFLKIFGTLYFLDGVMGTFTGSGFLDLSIFTQGVLNNPPMIKFLSSVPHLVARRLRHCRRLRRRPLTTGRASPGEARS